MLRSAGLQGGGCGPCSRLRLARVTKGLVMSLSGDRLVVLRSFMRCNQLAGFALESVDFLSDRPQLDNARPQFFKNCVQRLVVVGSLFEGPRALEVLARLFSLCPRGFQLGLQLTGGFVRRRELLRQPLAFGRERGATIWNLPSARPEHECGRRGHHTPSQLQVIPLLPVRQQPGDWRLRNGSCCRILVFPRLVGAKRRGFESL